MQIKTFGSVDGRSLDQLKRCMDAGDADFGVLCADHHPGYSQPIGGAIAYGGYVSPSGVGYDIGCIAAEERVLCADGCNRPIERATEVHNHHNFAWREEHGGRTYWVVRKGCTRAQPGQEGFVGGSMGDESVILEGVASDDAVQSLYSTVHGAGRVMSRSQAAGRVRRRKRWACNQRDCDRVLEAGPGGARPRCPEHPDAGTRKVWIEEQVRPGKVDWPAVQARLREQGVVLVGGGADEAPEVYKRLPQVLDAHAGTIRVMHTLRPLGVAMAGRDVHDPYKD